MLANAYQINIFNIQTEEQILIERAKNGDQAAFERIYENYHRSILALAFKLIGNTEDAYDTTQDVFTKAFKALPKTDTNLNLGAWLYRIATNSCMDVLRHRKKLQWLPWEAIVQNASYNKPYDAPEDHVIEQQTKTQVTNVLNKLHSQYRLSLVMREYMEFSYDEIAEVLSITPGAVKSLLFRAREQFRRLYKLESA